MYVNNSLFQDKEFQADLLSICFEYLNFDRQQQEAKDYLLLLVIRLQKEERIPNLKRYLNVISSVIDRVELNATQSEVILYSLALFLDKITVSLLPSLVYLLMVSGLLCYP